MAERIRAREEGGKPEPLRIVAAALLYKGGLIFSIPSPARHHNIINATAELLGIHYRGLIGIELQGFLTSEGEFLDRYEAKHLARRNGQLLLDASPSDQCFSEDLW